MENPIGSSTLLQFLHISLRVFINFLLPVMIIAYIIVGLMFITARGNAEKLKLARTAFLYMTIGTAIVLGAWVLAEMLGNTINAIN